MKLAGGPQWEQIKFGHRIESTMLTSRDGRKEKEESLTSLRLAFHLPGTRPSQPARSRSFVRDSVSGLGWTTDERSGRPGCHVEGGVVVQTFTSCSIMREISISFQRYLSESAF